MHKIFHLFSIPFISSSFTFIHQGFSSKIDAKKSYRSADIYRLKAQRAANALSRFLTRFWAAGLQKKKCWTKAKYAPCAECVCGWEGAGLIVTWSSATYRLLEITHEFLMCQKSNRFGAEASPACFFHTLSLWRGKANTWSCYDRRKKSLRFPSFS